MTWHGVDIDLVMYSATGVFLGSGLVLLGYAVSGAVTTRHRLMRFTVALVWASAFVSLMAALAVIFQ